MNRDELLEQFSHPMYAEVREYIYRIMLEHPEISDKFWIESAAEQMLECATDGVDIGTDNALRLTKGKKEISLDELVRRLSEAGVTNGNVFDVILGAELGDDFAGCELKKSAERKFAILKLNADILAKNPDIILLGVPVPVEFADWAQLSMAVFCPDLTKDEQTVIKNMTHWCDESAMFQEAGYLKLIFYIKDIWEA